jgi:hypothetical protein
MKNGYILLTQVMMDLQRMRGRIIQVGQRLNGSRDGLVRAAANEIEDMPRIIMTAMDTLVEVQAMLPEPSKGDIVRHFNPKAVNVKPLVLDPAAFLGVPGEITVDDELGIIGDGRPAGWTEALALEFIATQMSVECETFAALFNEGAWPTIQKEFPEFQTWLNSHMEGHRG